MGGDADGNLLSTLQPRRARRFAEPDRNGEPTPE